jgi:hypothetical protein
MSESFDSSLLHEVDALRAHLTACLDRLDYVERQLRKESAHPASPVVSPSADGDLFAQALPSERTPTVTDRRVDEAPGTFRIRSVSLAGDATATRPETPVACAPSPADQNAEPSSNEVYIDPFALISVSDVPPSPADASEVYRGMSALLGGLDVSTPSKAA